MKITNEIISAHPQSRVEVHSNKIQFIADFSKRTNFKRSVEIHVNNPIDPNNGGDMECLELHNDFGCDINYIVFDDYSYLNVKGKNFKHCEGVFSIKMVDKDIRPKWIVLFEIKDCKPSRVGKNRKEAKIQIKNVLLDLSDRDIFKGVKIYGIVSVPRLKINFCDAIFDGPVESKNTMKKYKIIMYTSNSVNVIDEDTFDPGLDE